MSIASIQAELDAIRADARWRSLTLSAGSGGKFAVPGGTVLNFSSNDYLDLAAHPRVIAGAQTAVAEAGCGATASRLMAGHFQIHERLETQLAALTGQPEALLFPTGFQANLGVLTALGGAGDVIFSDALNHASIIDGSRLARAQVAVYRHADVDHLEMQLQAHPSARRRIIVTDAIFSMDGDAAPLAELSALAHRYDALLVVDEAHAIGVYGGGGGLSRALGVVPDVVVGTLSKALGSAGGFVSTSALIRDLLINRARSFIYTTGLSPANAGAALAALAVLAETPSMGDTLRARARDFAAALRHLGLEAPDRDVPIVPIPLGDNARTMAAATALREQGLWVTGIRPPTVPEGEARLRLTVTLAHTADDLAEAAARIAQVLHALEATV